MLQPATSLLSKTKNERIRNSLLLIERFESRIPGFNRYSLSYTYWLDVCDAYGIRVKQRAMRVLHGLAIQGKRRPYIIVNSSLRASDKVIAIAHEFTHITDQILDTRVFLFTGDLWNDRKFDRQASIISVVGLMPECLVRGLSIEEIMADFGVRREVAEFRAGLNLSGFESHHPSPKAVMALSA